MIVPVSVPEDSEAALRKRCLQALSRKLPMPRSGLSEDDVRRDSTLAGQVSQITKGRGRLALADDSDGIRQIYIPRKGQIARFVK